jgi:type IV pilus assembly protein PilQ
MNNIVKYTVLFLLVCSNAVGAQKKSNDDPFALFKLPTQKATVHYIKKGGKEFVCLTGKDLKDYTVLQKDEGVSLDVKGHKIKARANLSNKSSYVENVKTSITDDGSMVDLKLKGNPGFKVYKRPSGLVLAMGPGYQEISEEMLQGVDTEASGSSSLDTELDSLLMENPAAGAMPPASAPQTADAANAKEIDSMVSSLDSETATKEAQRQIKEPIAQGAAKDKIDKELDRILAESQADIASGTEKDVVEQDLDKIVSEAESDLALYEQQGVEADLGKPAVIQSISIEKVGEKISLVIQANKPTKYKQRESKAGRNQIIVDIPNATLVKKLKNVDTRVSEGLIRSVTPVQLRGHYKTVRIVVKMNQNIQPEIELQNNAIYLAFAPEASEAAEGAVPCCAPSAKTAAISQTNDIEAARKFSRVNFEDYLARPTDFYGRRMSIQVSNANVLDVLRMIQEVSKINIVVSEKVKGKVDVSLKNVPWDQALSVVLQNAQLGYVRQGSVIRVAPLADLRDERKLAAEAIAASDELEPLRIMVAKLNYVSAAEVEQKVGSLLSKRGRVSVDKDAKTLVVHDIEDVVNKTDKLLRAIDVRPMQVAIEANIIEANNSWLRSMGFSWATQSGNIAFKNISGIGNIDALIGAASMNGEVKIVSAPKISAIDRQMASILQGTQVAYKTVGQTANGEPINKIEFENIEVSLNVTPRITENNEIILDISVKREFPDYTLRMSKTMPPGIGVRKATTQIMLKDGDTAVIGGLYSLDTGEANAGVPLIKKIPIVGWFFGKEEAREIRSEMMIFLKATVKKEDALAKI